MDDYNVEIKDLKELFEKYGEKSLLMVHGEEKYFIEVKGKFLVYADDEEDVSPCTMLNSRFYTEATPQTFNDVINCNREFVKVEHYLISINNHYDEFKNYSHFDEVLINLGSYFTSYDIKKILREGVWYIKGK